MGNRMRLNANRFYPKMFIVASIWNLVFVVIGVLFYDSFIRLLFSYSINPDDYYIKFMFHVILVFILIFGIGYYLVSRDLSLNRELVSLAAAGKIAVFIAFTHGFLLGYISLFGWCNLLGDVIWAFLFFAFLWSTRGNVKAI